MAPAVVEVAAGSAAKEFKTESAYARLLGSGKPAACQVANCKEFEMSNSYVEQDRLALQNWPYFTR